MSKLTWIESNYSLNVLHNISANELEDICQSSEYFFCFLYFNNIMARGGGHKTVVYIFIETNGLYVCQVNGICKRRTGSVHIKKDTKYVVVKKHLQNMLYKELLMS